MMTQKLMMLAALLALWGVGCGEEDPTGIRIKLVANPELNSEAQVLANLDRIQLVLRTPSGFSKLPADDALSLEDLDADGAKELIYSQEVTNSSAFPLLRLKPVGDSGRALKIAARGMVGAQIVAIGKPASATFTTGKSLEVSVPLDLRARYRPPRVVVTLPQDGQKSVPAALGYIFVEFSKWVDHAAAKSNLTLVYKGTSGDKTPSGTWQLTDSSVVELGLPEERTTATFALANCSLAPGTYKLNASTGIVDSSGNRLDQDALTAGAQAYDASFSLPGAAGTSACTGTKKTCTKNADCDTSDPPQFFCHKSTSGAGSCVPVPQSCDSSAISCPGGYMCQEKAGQPTCVACCETTCNREKPGCEVPVKHNLNDYIKLCCTKTCEPGCVSDTI